MGRGLKMIDQPALDTGSVLLAEDRLNGDVVPAKISDDALRSACLLLDERDGWQDEQRLQFILSALCDGVAQ
jgi:hypothetical protein